MTLPPKVYQFLLSCFVAVGSFTYGYDNGVIAQVVASESFTNLFKPTDNETGAVVSIFTGGGFAGAGVAGAISDRIGRRWSMFVATILLILGGSLQCGAQHINYMYAGRFFAGMGVGVFYMIIPIYQSEIAHPSIRGRLTALQQTFLGIGGLVSGWVAYGCYANFSNDDQRQFRVPLGLQIIPSLIVMSFIFFLPESPRWLIKKGRDEEGLRVVASLHAQGNKEDPFVIVENAMIHEDVEKEKANLNASLIKLIFSTRSNFRRILMAISLQASVQMTGVSAIAYFSPDIYAQLHLTTLQSLRLNAIDAVINLLIAQPLCIFLIDKLGRRWPIIVAHVLQGLTYIGGSITMAKYPFDLEITPRSAQIGFIATLWIFGFIFAVPGTTSWIIPAEIFNIQMRSIGVSIATMTAFAFTTMISQITPIAMSRLRYKFWYLFIVCNFTNAFYFYCFLPETGRTPLERMDDLWEDAPLFIPKWNRVNYLKEMESTAEEVQENGINKEKHALEHDEEVFVGNEKAGSKV
ncbi:general substrate transporter [Lipomyces japonicus]|uniref:general substrate transporter n=1 Tax=Lipomyces japonicus TaxID=56871 RepID=UPI0034D01E8D